MAREVTTGRGQSGLDRLTLFVLGVLVFLAVLPFVLNQVGLQIERQANATGSGPTTPVTPGRLLVLDAKGGAVDTVEEANLTDGGAVANGTATNGTATSGTDATTGTTAARATATGPSVGTVRIAVTAVDGPVDLSNLTVTWVDENSTYLVPAGAAGDANVSAFGVEGGGDGTLSPTERAVLTFDLGTDDVDGLPEFGRRLPAGTDVTVTIAEGDGDTTQLVLNVPAALNRTGDVSL